MSLFETPANGPLNGLPMDLPPSPPLKAARKVESPMPRLMLPIDQIKEVLLPDDLEAGLSERKLKPRKGQGSATVAFMEPLWGLEDATTTRPMKPSNKQRYRLKPRQRSGSKRRKMPPFGAVEGESHSFTANSEDNGALAEKLSALCMAEKQRFDRPAVLVPLPKKTTMKTVHALSA